MDEIICECGHSITQHAHIGCKAFVENHTPVKECECGLAPETVEALWQLKQMTAERDALKVTLYDLHIELAKARNHYVTACGQRDEEKRRGDLLYQAEHEALKQMTAEREMWADTAQDFARERDALAKKLEVAIGGLDWIKALFVENGEYNEATEKADEIKTEIAQPDNLYKDVSDSITASGESDAKQEAE